MSARADEIGRSTGDHCPVVPPPTGLNINIDRQTSSFTRLPPLIILIAIPSFYASRASRLMTTMCLHSTTSTARSSQTPTLQPLGSSPACIGDAWTTYLDICVAEWKAVFNLACVLVGFSMAMYQIPQAANNPLTYTFVSITQFRAFSGLIYAGVLHVYFKSEHTHTERFAMVWWKSVVGSEDNIWNTWVMLSLPAASTLWALIFYFLAILSFIFRSTAPAPDNHPVPDPLNVTLQVIIAASLLLDLVCLTCVWLTLREYGGKYRAMYVDA
ncbi:hypothetical protein BDZ94DRAFT_852381 [Collybia nuda]|uniref:Uncharacterized protein n=1 Tax=Collybia nuda TaxID=64659 RepID=A0A9P6CPP8_9AGAR|nr:hypothetical protein BDZ94DRAFT_852381 [Collybia nuda]